jgi:hypothetical protein
MRSSLTSASGALALGVAVAILVLSGLLGLLVDTAAGTEGWWLALGTLGLCGAALWLATVATRGSRV